MKVFFVQDSLANAGTEKSLLNILPHFSKDILVTLVYLYPRHDLLGAYNAANIRVIFLGLSGKYDFWRGQKRLFYLFRDEQPNLVVSSLLRTNLLCRFVCNRLNVPLLGTLVSDSYADIVWESKSFFQLSKFRFFWGLDRLTSGIPKLYIANSWAITYSHRAALGIPLQVMKVIHRGRAIPERVWTRFPKNTYTFLSFGRLLQMKGFEELIKAFSKVHQVYSNARLVIYGEGNYRKSLENLIEDLGLRENVQLPGVHYKVTDELYSADCFVFPSWYEGFSGALVEAMLSGIPIIASDIPMNLEAVTPNENALVFPVRDVNSLAKRMIYAVQNSDEMTLLGQKAREEASRRFDIKVISKQYEAVLRDAYSIYCKQ